METIDTLQIKIAKARAELSQDSRRAIDAVNWDQILLGMNTKYNSDQLDNLRIETELLLCGLTSTEEFPLELETRMKIPKIEVLALIETMDKLIFKKIQEELEKRIVNEVEEEATIITSKPLVLDPKFASIPTAVQEAVALSQWKEKLYEISRRYNLTVDKMGELEDITAKTISGTIKTDKFESEVKSKIDLSEDKLKEMIAEINTAIFINIKKTMMGDLNTIKPSVSSVPLPPYAINKSVVEMTPTDVIKKPEEKILEITKNETTQETINNIISDKTDNSASDIYREHGIEIIQNGYTPEPKEKEEEPKSNIISDKLFKNTSSQTIVTDYSLPKINTTLNTLPKMQGDAPTKPHDPYHEAI